MPSDPDSALVEEQIAYYDRRAPWYAGTISTDAAEQSAIEAARGELMRALDAFAPRGNVLELACGTGIWTPALERHAERVTAVDASRAMLDRARDAVGDDVTFVQADVFTWEPPENYDVVFFSFWLSHVPRSRFADFWGKVGACLAPGGRVFFIDEAIQEDRAEEWSEDQPEVVMRTLPDGSRHRVVKRFWAEEDLRSELDDLGWSFEIRRISPFYWGAGARSSETGS